MQESGIAPDERLQAAGDFNEASGYAATICAGEVVARDGQGSVGQVLF